MTENQIKNVIVVCDYGYIEGGAAKVAQQTALALNNKELNVVFFCAVGPAADILLENKIEVVCLNQSDILNGKNRIKAVMQGINNKTAKRAFIALLERFSPTDTVIHVHTWTKGLSSSIFPVAEKKKFKVFLTVHDYFLVCPNGGLFNYKTKKICELKPMSVKCLLCNCDSRSYPQKLFRVVRQWKQNRNIRRCKNVNYIFISEFSKKQFLRRYNKIPENRQYFLQNPIELDENRVRVKCEENDIYLYIGRVTEEKGIRVFCEAVTKAKVKAVVIGSGILQDELQNQYPDIEFVGWKSKQEMTPYIQKARCLIFPSVWYEGAPLTPLEVMEYGVPVICSDCNAAVDYIKDDNYGYIYSAGSVDSLCERIEMIKNDIDLKSKSELLFLNLDEMEFSLLKYTDCLIDILNKYYERENKKSNNKSHCTV